MGENNEKVGNIKLPAAKSQRQTISLYIIKKVVVYHVSLYAWIGVMGEDEDAGGMTRKLKERNKEDVANCTRVWHFPKQMRMQIRKPPQGGRG